MEVLHHFRGFWYKLLTLDHDVLALRKKWKVAQVPKWKCHLWVWQNLGACHFNLERCSKLHQATFRAQRMHVVPHWEGEGQDLWLSQFLCFLLSNLQSHSPPAFQLQACGTFLPTSSSTVVFLILPPPSWILKPPTSPFSLLLRSPLAAGSPIPLLPKEPINMLYPGEPLRSLFIFSWPVSLRALASLFAIRTSPECAYHRPFVPLWIFTSILMVSRVTYKPIIPKIYL